MEIRTGTREEVVVMGVVKSKLRAALVELELVARANWPLKNYGELEVLHG